MAEFFTNFFSYYFLNRALLVGILVSLCAALLGVSLVLKRYSMIGDGLFHVSFGALSIAVAMKLGALAGINSSGYGGGFSAAAAQ